MKLYYNNIDNNYINVKIIKYKIYNYKIKFSSHYNSY